MRSQRWAFRLSTSTRHPTFPLIRTQGARLGEGDGDGATSWLTLVRGLRARVANGPRIKDVMVPVRANIALKKAREVRPPRQGTCRCVFPILLVHIQAKVPVAPR